ncbi:MAG TPA: 5'-3' exonuclease H3TH domain-containing protein, partial [Acidimicrobiia bacterium]|nr:5'-3' exonuclease H3TH domain-containing protein [Acidimicrobiia bacterium]
MPTLALLDGHNLAYRAFFALPADLATPSGQVTNAVYGFTSMVIKLLGEEKPDAIAVAWDSPQQTFRAERYAEYKAQRQAAPDLFRSQLPLIHEVADVLRMPQITHPGWEADDIIATVARAAAAAGWDVLVVSGDRDAFQLVNDSIRVYYPLRGITETVIADNAYVTERFGITPQQYPDYAALRGDSSDNLPGVPGVGEKTASRLVA